MISGITSLPQPLQFLEKSTSSVSEATKCLRIFEPPGCKWLEHPLPTWGFCRWVLRSDFGDHMNWRFPWPSGYPQSGWFIVENPTKIRLKSEWFRATRISGNLHMGYWWHSNLQHSSTFLVVVCDIGYTLILVPNDHGNERAFGPVCQQQQFAIEHGKSWQCWTFKHILFLHGIIDDYCTKLFQLTRVSSFKIAIAPLQKRPTTDSAIAQPRMA